MRYLPLTNRDRKEMLNKIGLDSIDQLFSSIPENTKLKDKLQLGEPLDEISLIDHLKKLSLKNIQLDNIKSFIGAGCYNHYIPSAVDHILLRSEFYTAYTPYQPEVSQGTLQAIFEFQTLISQLFDMEITNGSMYDGATSLAEALLMAKRVNKKDNILISELVHPEYRDVLKTYISSEYIKELPSTEEGITNIKNLEENIDSDTTAVVIQYPNFLGNIEDLETVRNLITTKAGKALFIVVVTEPLAMGVLTPPGSFGADVVVGEGQSLGIPPSFGGPGLGLFSCKAKYLRKMPGRVCGETTDKSGKRGFVFTISTREQHIRRENATSNICSNHSLNAVACSIYLSLMGKYGFKDVALTNFYNTQYAIKMLSQFPDIIKIKYGKKVFNEFVIEFSDNVDSKLIYNKLLSKNIILGLNLGKFYQDSKNSYLINVTELISQKDIADLVNALIEIMGEL